MNEGEPCTRTAALDAGMRLALQCPAEVLVLQHTGADGGRWHLQAHHFENGRAVAEFKRLRGTLVRGGLALWQNGRVARYEVGTLASPLSRSGSDRVSV